MSCSALTGADVLIWEYPRRTPSGEPAGLVESMDLDDDGQLAEHRVYRGWRGVVALIEKQMRAGLGA